MAPMAFIRKAWSDNVWSKVIASGITTGLGTMFVLLFHYWEALKGAETPIAQIANTPVVVPAWFVAALVILLMGAVGSALRAVGKGVGDVQSIEPNAIPIVEATIVAPTFMDTVRGRPDQPARSS